MRYRSWGKGRHSSCRSSVEVIMGHDQLCVAVPAKVYAGMWPERWFLRMHTDMQASALPGQHTTGTGVVHTESKAYDLHYLVKPMQKAVDIFTHQHWCNLVPATLSWYPDGKAKSDTLYLTHIKRQR